MKVAIAGSSGLIGSALGALLESEHHKVVRLVRGPSTEEGSMWDPASGWMRPDVLAGCDAVVNLSGASIGDGRWSAARKAEILESRLSSTRVLREHMATYVDGPRRLVNPSAIGYYGDRGDEVLDEMSGRGQGFLSDVVAAWEAEALAGISKGLDVVCARLGVVLSEEGGALAKMLTPFKLGVGGRLGNGRQWMSWISLEDAARAFLFLLEADIEGSVNLAAPEPVRNADFTKSLGRILHRPTLLPIPRLPLRLMMGESVDELLFASQRVRPYRLEAAGFAFAHPDIDVGLEAAFATTDADSRVGTEVEA